MLSCIYQDLPLHTYDPKPKAFYQPYRIWWCSTTCIYLMYTMHKPLSNSLRTIYRQKHVFLFNRPPSYLGNERHFHSGQLCLWIKMKNGTHTCAQVPGNPVWGTAEGTATQGSSKVRCDASVFYGFSQLSGPAVPEEFSPVREYPKLT